MDYCLKAGMLYAAGQEEPLASIRAVLGAQTRKIFAPDGGLLAHTEVRLRSKLDGTEQGVEKKEYVLYDCGEKECAVARPAYCEQDAPSVAGWPVCRTPRADCAHWMADGKTGVLKMRDSEHYSLQTEEGISVQLTHRGLRGGWDVKASEGLSAVFLCAVFLFCRYLERENEFPMV